MHCFTNKFSIFILLFNSHGFFGIDNPEQVEALLLETFQNDEVSRLEDQIYEESEASYSAEDAARTESALNTRGK